MFSLFRKRPKFGSDLVRLLARAEARAREYSHDYVGVEHVFLCFRDLPETDEAAQLLKLLPVDGPAFWADLERQTKVITGRPVPNVLPHTPRLDWVLRAAEAWAVAGKETEVTALHFLAGVGQDRNSLVAHVLRGYLAKKNPEFTNTHALVGHFVMKVAFPYAVFFQKEESPNKLLQPTPATATPPADAGSAPATSAADR